MDKYKLEYEMKSRGITIEKLCSDLNISRSAFYRKCNGISEFTQSEIQNIVDYIGHDSPMGIFLQKKYHKRHYTTATQTCTPPYGGHRKWQYKEVRTWRDQEGLIRQRRFK